MKKPWSVTTTVRNPHRIKEFLSTLQYLDNKKWNKSIQEKYQVLLIKNRYYGFGSTQFYKGLTDKQIKLIDSSNKKISCKQAAEIFEAKNYNDPPHRGRESINPLKKFGLATTNKDIVKITEQGKLLLQENGDLGDTLFKSFMKWQIPNPSSREYPANSHYNIKPFIGTIHLIRQVNLKEKSSGSKPTGISQKEFSVFVPTLIHYQDIDEYAEKIISIRNKQRGKNRKQQTEIFHDSTHEFISKFLNTSDTKKINKCRSNLKDYGDNALRYFRLTRFITIRGGGYRIDLEPRRSIEINSILGYDNAQSKEFASADDYIEYMVNIAEPKLPWDTIAKHIQIAEEITSDIQVLEKSLGKSSADMKEISEIKDSEIKEYIEFLRDYRRELQDIDNYNNSQSTEQIEECIKLLENIYEHDDRPILLEKFSTIGLNAMNDAIKIHPNYPVGDDNEPTFTAAGNRPDIECFYKTFNAICEVTMMNGSNQWYHESQPVMRHLADFEKKHGKKETYALFIAPSIHRDTINTFWSAIKYEYESKPRKIIPLTIKQFISILKMLLKLKDLNIFLKHSDISNLYNQIISATANYEEAGKWAGSIDSIIKEWKDSLLSQNKK